MVRRWVPLVSGFLFSVGLAVSGMTDPNKVIAFLDFAGDWDPSLALVMIAAVGCVLGARRFRRSRNALGGAARGESLGRAADVPLATGFGRARLLVGSVMFGVGWGLAGYCPGPAVAAVASGASTALASAGSILLGIFLHEALLGARRERSSAPGCGGVDLA